MGEHQNVSLPSAMLSSAGKTSTAERRPLDRWQMALYIDPPNRPPGRIKIRSKR